MGKLRDLFSKKKPQTIDEKAEMRKAIIDSLTPKEKVMLYLALRKGKKR